MAVIFVVPKGRDDNVIEAVPDTTGISPTTTLPVLKRTVPMGRAPVAEIVAVNVTASPCKDGFSDEARIIVIGSFTPKWIAPIARKFAVPLKRIE